MLSGSKAFRYGRSFSIILFGVVFPAIILFQAYQGIDRLNRNVSYDVNNTELISDLYEAKKHIINANDYALFSLMYVEHANQKTMINKQVMKTSVINIGFSVISIGIMLIILGIREDTENILDAKFEVSDIKVDLKTGSAGIAVFCIGAGMATLGGVLKNDYQTSEIPGFESMQNEYSDVSGKLNMSIESFKYCMSLEEDGEKCFMDSFFQINESLLK